MSYSQDASSFYERYSKLEEREKARMSKLVNKLLSVNFFCRAKETDRDDYYFCVRYEPIFKAYFSLMDYDLKINKQNEVVALSNREGYNHLQLRLNESLILLILRKMYYKKMNELSLNDNISMRIGELHEEIMATNRFDKRIGKKELGQIIRLYKRYNLIDMIGDVGDDDSVLILYPSILYAISITQIEEVERKIDALAKGESVNEENHENEAD